jgi:hypothetical protein
MVRAARTAAQPTIPISATKAQRINSIIGLEIVKVGNTGQEVNKGTIGRLCQSPPEFAVRLAERFCLDCSISPLAILHSIKYMGAFRAKERGSVPIPDFFADSRLRALRNFLRSLWFRKQHFSPKYRSLRAKTGRCS